MAKDIRRIVRELDVPTLVGDRLLKDGDGAFQDGEGRRRVGGKERVREADHRMWAARAVGLGEGKDGTGGEDDYQVRAAELIITLRRCSPLSDMISCATRVWHKTVLIRIVDRMLE